MSWSEILLIAVVGLIVIGPKDLPKVVKVFMQFAQKARSLAREFQSGVEEMAREAELHEMKAALEKDVSTDFSGELEHSIDPGGNVARSLDLEAQSEPSIVPPPALPASNGNGVASAGAPREVSPSEESKDPIFVDALPATEPGVAEVRAEAELDPAPPPPPKS
ncbi:MAG TPA: Sec-independent protein translocase protein TatB [Alphaproteobacteria bacterium]